MRTIKHPVDRAIATALLTLLALGVVFAPFVALVVARFHPFLISAQFWTDLAMRPLGEAVLLATVITTTSWAAVVVAFMICWGVRGLSRCIWDRLGGEGGTL